VAAAFARQVVRPDRFSIRAFRCSVSLHGVPPSGCLDHPWAVPPDPSENSLTRPGLDDRSIQAEVFVREQFDGPRLIQHWLV
jgi:hypothetical protein